MTSILTRVKDLKAWSKTTAADNFKHRMTKKVLAAILSFFRILIMTGICYIILSPLLGILSNAVKDVRDVYNPLVYMIPETFTLANFQNAISYMDFLPVLLQTLVFVLVLTGVQILITSMVGYGFARFKFPGNSILFGLMIVTIVVPLHTYMVPLYMQFRYFLIDFGLNINLLNNYLSILLLTVTGIGLRSGLYIYIFRQFFKGLPKEIEEAALIDGAGQMRTFFTVMLPNAMSAIVTVLMFALVWQYNDTLYASLFIPQIGLMATKLTALGSTFRSMASVNEPNLVQLVVNAGVVLTLIPIITIYLAMQRYFMEGIERSGIVG